jgi:prepilin-type N-terminal cleavage/methylation domain-containing protein
MASASVEIYAKGEDLSKLTSRRGLTLIEIVFSMTLLAIIAVGTAQYMVYSRWDIERGIRHQLAWMAMASRLEQCVDFGFETIPDSIPETLTSLTISGLQAYRSSMITGIDDSTDGLWPTDTNIPDYYEIKIYIAWFDPADVSDSLTAYLSEETSWNY